MSAPRASPVNPQRFDRSFQTVARAKPARPEVGVSSDASGRLRPKAFQVFLAPLRTPLVELDTPAQNEVDERRVLARPRVDLPQDLQVLLVALLAALEEQERFLARQRVGEEEPQQRLVAELNRHRRAEEPFPQRLAPGFGQLVGPPATRAAGRILAFDQAFLLQAAQLGIDLPIAGCPEEAGRAIDDGLDVVARPRAQREHSENYRRHRVHISLRYIVAQ